MGNYAFSSTIFALLYSIIATELGLLPRDATTKAGASGLIFMFVIFSAFASIGTSNMHEIIDLLVPIGGMILLGVLGILIATSIVGKVFFKFDWKLSFILGLNCLLGFPLNYSLTLEAIEVVAQNDNEKQYLNNKYVPMMLVAGFVTITIGSVLLAGIMKGFIL